MMSAKFLERVRSFAREEIADKGNHFDGLPEMPTPELGALAAAGLANWWVPEQYGGAGVSLEDSVDVMSELAYADAGFAFSAFPTIIGSTMLRLYPNAPHSRRYLEELAGGGFCAVLASEQEAGSELGRTATSAVRVGDRLVVDGEKYFSTNADCASLLFVLARDEDGGFGMVLVPRDTSGIEIVKRWDMVGVRGSGTYQVALRRCAVAADSRLPGNGIRNLEVALNASRILIASIAIGIGRRIRDLAMDYAAGKQLKGAPLTENAVFAAKLGQIEMTIDVMRNQCRAAAAQVDAGFAAPDPTAVLYRAGALRSALAAKAYCGQAGWQLASVGSELFGGLGYTHDHPVQKLVRDVRHVSIVEGGEDVLRDLVYSRFVLPAGKRR
jgi:alkylation response protein AidB-like acyl-CoA dehydrogenase